MLTKTMTLIKQTSRILIVDDTPANVFLLEQLLKLSGYTNIVTLTDSREVLSTYQTFQPDLLLLDLKMPYLDGFDILKQLNALENEDYLSVIVITAQSDKENRLKSLELGARDFIGKPFDHTEVIMRVTNLLEIRLLHNATKENNRLLEERVTERTREIENIQLELVNKLLIAAEFRDDNTGNHILRIGQYAAVLGQLWGLDQSDCLLLSQAAMMHDIGKIGVPDGILLKPGPLTVEEMAIMKTHTQKGADILTGSAATVLQLGEVIALSHHEKWDGSGYPAGLAADAIPLEGRITAICDVFDALLSERPYKPAWTMNSTLDLMAREAGHHFDPELLQLFLDNVDRFIKIYNECTN
ncbi:HD domain-containing phosphohydrolase [Acetobacterium wieringae]|uniref:HD domain-containing phosphohydrolase n=1 Tax=Acetobacterium wieringae TaxID=52694 RepID=UPI0026ECC923|nr:HD domain-containing phosphohydrolase [Acetobacterium wieringae]